MKRSRKTLFSSRRIVAVSVGQGTVVSVTWEGGETSAIDLAPWLEHPVLAGLRDAALFAGAAVGEYGWTVAWGGEEFEIDSIHLQLLEAEGQGLVFFPEAMRRWRERHGLSLEQAAQALGLSRRMIAYYESGEKAIPKSVALACKGYGALQAERRVRPAA
jgi:DNA-binding XRE family transcriptional regulator